MTVRSNTPGLVAIAGCEKFKTGNICVDFETLTLKRNRNNIGSNLNDYDWWILAALAAEADTEVKIAALSFRIGLKSEIVASCTKLRELMGTAYDGKFYLTATASFGFKLRSLPTF